MACQGWTDENIDEYYGSVIGTEITKVFHDADVVWMHLSDGSMLEVVAENGGGFTINIHPPTYHLEAPPDGEPRLRP